jgi:replication factor C subunit 3/5
MIHLNASDERGIDIIRNQINSFVNSKSLFNNGMKFVILDEVDYMTKNAQIALRYLLQGYNSNVRFCLICNYISRIDEALQNEFVRLRFNQLPEYEIIKFLKNINDKESLNFNNDSLKLIQNLFNSDIRSMINYMQSNENLINDKKIIKNELWDTVISSIKENDLKYNIEQINDLSSEYNIEKRNILKNMLNYIIRYKKEYVNTKLLDITENIMHISDCNQDILVNYSILQMKEIL